MEVISSCWFLASFCCFFLRKWSLYEFWLHQGAAACFLDIIQTYVKPLMEIMCQYYWKSFSHSECVICNIPVLVFDACGFWVLELSAHTSFFTVPIRPECCCFMNIVYGEVPTWRWEDADIWGLLSSCRKRRKPQKGSDALSLVTRVIHKNLHHFVITEKSENGNGGKNQRWENELLYY